MLISLEPQIINAALSLQEVSKRTKVILVTKDINLRIKCKALGLESEDYKTGKVKDLDNFSAGFPAFNDIDAGIRVDV